MGTRALELLHMSRRNKREKQKASHKTMRSFLLQK